MEISKCGKQALRRVAAQILVFVMLLSNIISEPLMTLADGGGMQLSQANVEFLAWHLDIPELTGYWYATDGVNANNSVLEFIYATGARGPGHATRWPANVPNTADGWFMRGGAGFGPGVSGGWLLTLSTAGWQDITFSAQQSSSNQGPSEFGLAYRLSEADSWNSFGDGSWDRVTVADGGADGRTFGDTFVNVPLPEAVSDQDFVQIKIYIATDMRRSGTPSLGHDGGNTSINNIVFAGNPVDSELLAWRVERPDPASNQYRTATDGSNAAASTLEFFYADGTRATLGRNQDDRMPVNVPNNAGRWFPADGEINANTSAGWVITFDATGWEDATFSAQQSSSNNGPSEFGLAFRLSTSDAWTSFGDASWDRVTVNGDTTAGSGIISLGDTFIDVPLPAAINNQPFVQIKAYIASAARRSDGALTLDATGGNTSINNIVFARASTPGVIVVNRAPLAATIADAQGRVESHFTTVSWQNMQAALAAAIAVYGNEYAVQQEVNAARSALVSALNALAPVMPDLSGSDNGNLRFVGDFLIAPAAVADDGGAA
ncbi:MAG: hypothetical protein FWB75_08845, partial [Oscillospiraceae bacterium]|nr:hypothetical protein [Oscillospiraceae bacterium]